MAKRTYKRGELDDRAICLFKMLIADHQHAIAAVGAGDEIEITPAGDVMINEPIGIWRTLLGQKRITYASFLDVCKDIKSAIMSDPGIQENLKKPIDNYLMDAFKSSDKDLLIRRLFYITLNLSDKNTNNNQNNDNQNNKDGRDNNKNNKNDQSNENNNNKKKNPPKRLEGDGTSNSLQYVGVPGMRDRSGNSAFLLLPNNPVYLGQQDCRDFRIIIED